MFLVQRPHRFQPLARKKNQRKCAPLDKFTWTSAVLDSHRGRDRLLDANNSIMETDGEGKFVSFVVLGGTSLFKMNHGFAGLDCLVCRFYWSTGAAEGLIMVDSGACLRGEIPRKFFLCVIAFVGKTLTLTEKKELEVLPSLDDSLTHVRLLCRWVRAHRSGERGGEQTRKSGRRDLLKWTSFVCFSLHCKTVAC